jgi:hypothetical protein
VATLGAFLIKWGQININFQSKGQKAKGDFLILEYQKSFSPPLPFAL